MVGFKNYLHGTSGNFAVMASLDLYLITLGTVAAIETSNMTRVKNQLQFQYV